MGFTNRWKQIAGATVGVGALAFTFACNTAPQATGAVPGQQPQINQAGTPVMVNCEPQQRAVVRPAVVNGVAMSQVDCVAVTPAPAVASAGYVQPAASAQPPAYAQPVGYRAPVTQVVQPVSSDLGDAQIVPVSTRTVRPVRTNQVVYDERPVRKTRSVAKSAIIIGSSAGAGAGVGAAIGGKKGALIGAAIGGGGATIWDQVTRRK
jgi:hypothetical protein